MKSSDFKTVAQNRSNLLFNTIAQLRLEFISMKAELQNVYDENNKLKEELEKRRNSYDNPLDFDLHSLRRRISFYCHPDRGGDVELMKDLNSLFDFLSK